MLGDRLTLLPLGRCYRSLESDFLLNFRAMLGYKKTTGQVLKTCPLFLLNQNPIFNFRQKYEIFEMFCVVQLS